MTLKKRFPATGTYLPSILYAALVILMLTVFSGTGEAPGRPTGEPPKTVAAAEPVPSSPELSPHPAASFPAHLVDRDRRTLRVVATAYTASPEEGTADGVTATGLPAERGMAAVDPSIIPLGSVIRIPGLGYFVAGDTGSAIKGYRLDIFMEDRARALSWGRREVEVEIIKLGTR